MASKEKQLDSKSISSALIWKILERFGVQGTQFVLQIVLARILDPEHYGVLSMMTVFITLANVFIQRGFNTALVQNKDVTEDDYSSVFWVTLSIAVIIYMGLFSFAPAIATFYRMPKFVSPFRVICLVLFPGALNSIQLAKISRKLDFKKVFKSNVLAIVVSGVVGIVMACVGAGLWALVIQYLLNVLIACIVMFFTVRWTPRFICKWHRVKILISFGWKLLVSGLFETAYQDLRSLVIGKKYDSGTLAYYTRGKQFPQFIINAVNSAVQSVMLPAMSSNQENKAQIKVMARNSITISSYIIIPMMAGLAAISEPLVRIILTEKWIDCVPYMQIYCFTLGFYPVHSCNLQAINAMGRSDIFLKLEIIKKTLGVFFLVFAVLCFDSPIAIAMTGIISTLINFFVNARPNKRVIGYSFGEQVKDILPPFLAAWFMAAVVWCFRFFELSDGITVFLQIFFGIVLYLLISILLRMRSYVLMRDLLIKVFENKKKRHIVK